MKDNFCEILSKKIKELRREKKFTQSELAWKIGVSPNFISLIERGKKKPSLDTLLKIAEVFEVNPSIFSVEFKYKFGDEDILIKKISSILKEGTEEDKKVIYQIVKSIIKKKK